MSLLGDDFNERMQELGQTLADGRMKDLAQSAPNGSITLFAGEVPPSEWRLCDGRNLARDEYPRLFKLIGTKFGEGDGISTFNLPDLPSPFAGIRYIIKVSGWLAEEVEE